jgi:hypothetical protein
MNKSKNPVEMELHADDMEVKVESTDADTWLFHITGLKNIDPEETEQVTLTLNAQQASAVLALFVNGFEGQDIEKYLYEIAEPVFKGQPNHLRIIP